MLESQKLEVVVNVSEKLKEDFNFDDDFEEDFVEKKPLELKI